MWCLFLPGGKGGGVYSDAEGILAEERAEVAGDLRNWVWVFSLPDRPLGRLCALNEEKPLRRVDLANL